MKQQGVNLGVDRTRKARPFRRGQKRTVGGYRGRAQRAMFSLAARARLVLVEGGRDDG